MGRCTWKFSETSRKNWKNYERISTKELSRVMRKHQILPFRIINRNLLKREAACRVLFGFLARLGAAGLESAPPLRLVEVNRSKETSFVFTRKDRSAERCSINRSVVAAERKSGPPHGLPTVILTSPSCLFTERGPLTRRSPRRSQS